jgi:phosphate transport system permease protein
VITASSNYTLRKWKSRIFLGACAGSLLVALVPLLSILWEVFSRGVPIIDGHFLFDRQIFQYREGGGVANAILGSFYITGLASLIGIPIGILAGIYLSEYGHGRFADSVRFFSDVFAEFPSIVIGLFAYVVVVGTMGHFSIFAGAVALAVMMIPIVTRTTEESLHLVPLTVREASLALGIPKWKTTLRITLSTARAGLVTGAMLSFARIFGETAPLIVTIGGSLYFADSIDDTSSALTYVVWRGATSGIPEAEVRAWGAAALLLIIVLIINVVIRFVMLRRQAQGGST